MKKIRRRAAIEADEKIKKLMDELNEPTSTKHSPEESKHAPPCADSFIQCLARNEEQEPNPNPPRADSFLQRLAHDGEQEHNKDPPRVDSFIQCLACDEDQGRNQGAHQTVPHHGISLHSTQLNKDHSIVDLSTYSRGRRLFWTPHLEKNRFFAHQLSSRIFIPIDGRFSLLESTSLCGCEQGHFVKGNMIMFRESTNSLWSFGVLVFAHYLLPGLGSECDFDIWEWVGSEDDSGIPDFFLESNWTSMNPHFRQRTIRSDTMEMKFVNIVRGNQKIVNPSTRNWKDGGIQSSKFGPCSVRTDGGVSYWRENNLSGLLLKRKPPESYQLWNPKNERSGPRKIPREWKGGPRLAGFRRPTRKRGPRRPRTDKTVQSSSKLWTQEPSVVVSDHVKHNVVIVKSSIGSDMPSYSRHILPWQKNQYLLPSLDKNQNGTLSFGFVSEEVIRQISSSTYSTFDYELLRVDTATGIVDLLPIDNADPNVCTKVFAGESGPQPDETFTKSEIPSSFFTVYQKECQASDYDEYVPLSCSLFDSKTQGVQVTMTHINLIRKAIGSSRGLFQKRKRCIHGGELSYVGPRDPKSFLCQPSPSEGPSESGYQYYQHTISHLFWPFVLSFGSLLSSRIVRVRHYIHPHLNLLRLKGDKSPMEIMNVCRLLILTVSFYCALHVDSDEVAGGVDFFVLQLLSIINDGSVSSYHKKRAERSLSHVKEWGLGVPTTCGYQIVDDEDSTTTYKEVEVVQYFCCVGLGICFRIQDHWTHLFLAHCFSHLTSVPLFICDNAVHIGSYEGKVIFAWGQGNNGKTTPPAAAAQRRTPASSTAGRSRAGTSTQGARTSTQGARTRSMLKHRRPKRARK